MSKVFRFVWSIWASFAFMFWIILAYLVYLLVSLVFGSKKDKQFLLFFYKFIGNGVTYSTLLFVKKRGFTGYDAAESYVVVSNHQTMMDIPANVVGIPKNIIFKFLGKKEADRLPFFGHLINRLCILVDRKDQASRKSSFKRMKDEMDKGFSIFIYPEGTRNRTDEPIKDFYDGAFRLAIEMQKPLVVNTLVGIRELNPPSGFFTYRPGRIESHWEEPISTKGLTLDDIDDLKKQVASLMIKRLAER